MKTKVNKSKGFTIIELLIATTVFSIILVGLLSVFVQISRMYYKGINMSNTQNATRTITQDLVDDIRFGSSAPNAAGASGGTASGYFCVGTHRYTYYLGQQVGAVQLAGMFRETVANTCPSLVAQPVDTSTADQLLDAGQQLNRFNLSCSLGRCLISVHVIFFGGDHSGLFASASNPTSLTPWLEKDAECTGGLTSSQFCATADYNRTLLQKV